MQDLIQKINEFNKERNWGQYHSLDNLAKSIAIEAGELLECFQWDENSFKLEKVKDELADVLSYCLQMSSKLGVDPEEIILSKMDKLAIKYPVEQPDERFDPNKPW